MSISSVAHLVFIVLSVVAGIGVLRNPIRVGLNVLAGLSYFVAAIAAFLLDEWWPFAAGWGLSLSLQGLCTWRMCKGKYRYEIDAMRAAKGLPPLQYDTDPNGESDV